MLINIGSNRLFGYEVGLVGCVGSVKSIIMLVGLIELLHVLKLAVSWYVVHSCSRGKVRSNEGQVKQFAGVGLWQKLII